MYKNRLQISLHVYWKSTKHSIENRGKKELKNVLYIIIDTAQRYMYILMQRPYYINTATCLVEIGSVLADFLKL